MNNTNIDEKDVKILVTIAKSGTGSPEEIASETGIPKSTVHYRLDSLREKGIFTNDIFDVDLEKLGLHITVITEVNANYDEGYHDKVGQKLVEIEGANQVYFTMGDTDFIVISHLANQEMVEGLVEQFEAIEEVNRTSSKFVIKTLKNEPCPINDYSIDTLLQEL